ncbi:hypothetical protein VNO77_46198 [Canavalia gladiata]|uniref:Uncharacterized protein n=1 Tax=Canavalia gladiata TaxID=3824 RepID=A0AAN9PIH6_CANGL
MLNSLGLPSPPTYLCDAEGRKFQTGYGLIKSSSPRVTVYYAILPISKGEFPDTAPLLVALPAKEDKVPAKTSVKVKAKSLVVFNSESDFTNGISI